MDVQDNQTYFSDNGDGLDFANSNAKVLNNYFSNFKDKAISIGEKSDVYLNNNFIINSNIGYEVKDNSKVSLKNNNFKKVEKKTNNYIKKNYFTNDIKHETY